MNAKKSTMMCALAFFIIFSCAVVSIGQMNQMNPIHRFKKVMIPVDLLLKDSILPKGEYDLEFLRVSSPLSYHLRIMKKGKILHLLQGKEFPYEDLAESPKNPTLKMSKNRDDKMLILVFESGKTVNFPMIRTSFQLEYEGD